MSFALILERRITSFVHPDIMARPAERLRHQTFILRRLASSLAVLGLMPPFLAAYGAPAAWQALVFVLFLLPVGAVALVSRTGHLMLAQAICVASFVGAALTIATASGPWQAALICLAFAPFEGVFSQNRRLVLAGGLLAASGAASLALAAQTGLIEPGFASGHSALFVLAAIAYATALAYGIVVFQDKLTQSDALHAEHYRAVYDAIGDLVVHYDRNGSVEFVSPNCLDLFGLPAAEFAGRGLFERIHVADRPAFLKAIADAATTSDFVFATLRLRTTAPAAKNARRPEATFRWVEMRARRFGRDISTTPGAAAVRARVVSILHDVTSTKQREEEFEAVRAATEETNLWKDQFLANVSHELRTPLNAIIGFAEMLANVQLVPQDPEKRREYASIIQQSGLHLLSVVNSILDMSKIQSGTFDIRPESFAIAPLIDLCCDMVKLKAQANGVELIRVYPKGLDEVIGDKRACKQILINLLSNAVKFTPRDGHVTVKARPDGTSLILSVCDTGIGMSTRDLAHLGDPFFQAGASYDRPYEGTGLGLSVVRGLVGLHGGSICVESEPGKGTSVSVRLPLDCRQLARGKKCTARIETIARRSGGDDSYQFGTEMMVKKIA
ncbi:MAG: PAS domain-containing sensor histidine kinase [Methylovirgula sp.]